MEAISPPCLAFLYYLMPLLLTIFHSMNRLKFTIHSHCIIFFLGNATISPCFIEVFFFRESKMMRELADIRSLVSTPPLTPAKWFLVVYHHDDSVLIKFMLKLDQISVFLPKISQSCGLSTIMYTFLWTILFLKSALFCFYPVIIHWLYS